MLRDCCMYITRDSVFVLSAVKILLMSVFDLGLKRMCVVIYGTREDDMAVG